MRNSIKIIKFFAAPYRSWLCRLAALAIASAGCEYLSIALLFNFFRSMFGSVPVAAGSGSLFLYIQRFIGLLPIRDPFIASCVAISVVTLISVAVSFMFKYQMEFFTQRVRIDFQRSVASRYLGAEYEFFVERSQGTLLFNILQAPQYISMVLNLLVKTSASIIALIFLVSLLLLVSYKITLLLILFCVIIGFIVALASKHIGYFEGKKANSALASLNIVLNEFITGIKEIKVNSLKGDTEKRIDIYNRNFFDAKMKVVLYRIMINNVFPAISMLAICAIFIFIKKRYAVDMVTVIPALAVYAAAIIKIVPLIRDIGEEAINISHYMPNFVLVYDELNNKASEPFVGGNIENPVMGEIAFNEVFFSHGAKHILSGASFVIDKNKTAAIVGGSGAGKTTCANLILKLYRLQKGVITISGIDLDRLERDALMGRIGVVFQNPILFNRTIGENISLREDYYACLGDIERVVALANMSDFIKALPRGYDTMAGDLGDKLSAGQKQRMVLARALFKNPELLILDEATSSLDNISERAIMSTIQALRGKMTILIITHKLTSIEGVDKIMVLKNGCISDAGPHAELLEKHGDYYHLYHAQQIAENI